MAAGECMDRSGVAGRARRRAGRKQRDFRASVRALLACQIPDEELRQRLDALGLDTTVLNAIHNGVFEKALRGDVSAARYLRDLAEEEGEKKEPSTHLDLSRLSDLELRRLAAGVSSGETAGDRP